MKFQNARGKACYQLLCSIYTVRPNVTMAVNCTKQNIRHEAICRLLKSVISETVKTVTG